MALSPVVSLFDRLVARSRRNRGNRRNDKPSTVTLAAHARRGLTNNNKQPQAVHYDRDVDKM